MIPAPWLAVVFAGILGGTKEEAKQVGHQVIEAIRDMVELEPIIVPPKDLRVLTHHGGTSSTIVDGLHVDGLIAGELIDDHGTLTLRLVVYSSKGSMRSLTEIPLTKRRLGQDDIASIRTNLSDEVTSLAPKALARPAVAAKATPVVAPKPAPVVVAKAAPVVAPKPAPVVAPKPAPVVAVKAAPKAAPPADPAPEIDMSVEAEPTTVAAADDAEVPAADEPAVTASTTASAEDDEDPVLGMRVAAAFGVSARNFAPGPVTLPGYSASAVGTFGVTAEIRPAKRLCLDAVVERTLAMSTPMGNVMAPTAMSRWEISADYIVHPGRFVVAARGGLGRRSFSIDTNDASATPDSNYNYLILGGTVSTNLGRHVTVAGIAAFEPVVSGSEGTEMAFGEASRWAVDVGAAIDIRPRAHVFARVAADVQRFAWSWDGAGARGTGGAVDMYPTGTVSLGAEY